MSEVSPIDEIPQVDLNQTPLRSVTNELGENAFLQLFITQLQNQDPMEPVNDADFIAQLAQFSTLEQLTKINTTLESGMGLSDDLAPLSTLEDINARLEDNLQNDLLLSQTINNTTAAAMIDRTVTWQTDTIALGESGDVDLYYGLSSSVDAVVAKVYDDQGNLVRIMSTNTESAGEHHFTWDGKDNDGDRLSAGAYTVEISSIADGETQQLVPFFRGKVDGVRYIEGQAYLHVGELLIPLSEVSEISA